MAEKSEDDSADRDGLVATLCVFSASLSLGIFATLTTPIRFKPAAVICNVAHKLSKPFFYHQLSTAVHTRSKTDTPNISDARIDSQMLLHRTKRAIKERSFSMFDMQSETCAILILLPSDTFSFWGPVVRKFTRCTTSASIDQLALFGNIWFALISTVYI